jgi:hypothetical protein
MGEGKKPLTVADQSHWTPDGEHPDERRQGTPADPQEQFREGFALGNLPWRRQTDQEEDFC